MAAPQTNFLPLSALVLCLAACFALPSLALADEPLRPPQDPVIELDPDTRSALASLGESVVGKALPAPTITAPKTLFALEDRRRTYRYTSGQFQGQEILVRLTGVPGDASGASWLLAEGDQDLQHLHLAADGLVLVAEQDFAEGTLSRFDPPEPVLLQNLAPRDTRQLDINVAVYGLHDPADVKYHGRLKLTYRYVGAYEVTTDAGQFDAVLIEARYQGKIGPASVSDLVYTFYAPAVGEVASVERSTISALIFYHTTTVDSRLLSNLSPSP